MNLVPFEGCGFDKWYDREELLFTGGSGEETVGVMRYRKPEILAKRNLKNS